MSNKKMQCLELTTSFSEPLCSFFSPCCCLLLLIMVPQDRKKTWTLVQVKRSVHCVVDLNTQNEELKTIQSNVALTFDPMSNYLFHWSGSVWKILLKIRSQTMGKLCIPYDKKQRFHKWSRNCEPDIERLKVDSTAIHPISKNSQN